jgi:hypothetical protein
MKTRTLLRLLVLAVASTVAAFWAIMERPAYMAASVTDEPAFPALRQAPDSVRMISISGRFGGFTIEQTDDAWITPEKFGFEVNGEKVAALVTSLSDMRLVAQKTSRPELYGRLDLADPEEDPESRALHIVLSDAGGDVLAEAVFGKKRWRRTGSERTGIYIRRPGEEMTWLASGGETLEGAVEDWLQDEILDIKPDRRARIVIEPLGEDPYEIFRETAEEPFLLPDLPEGGIVGESSLNRIAGTLAGLKFDDLRPLQTMNLPSERDRGRFVTLDGLEITTERMSIDDDFWMVLQFGAGEDAGEEVRAEAAKLNAKLGSWAFRIPNYVAERIATPLSDLLENEPQS